MAARSLDGRLLCQRITEIARRHPTVGLAAAVVADGSVSFCNHGVAEVTSQLPITEDTVFRIGSLTKTFTAVAVLQLSEQAVIELDAPVDDHLRAYQLVRANSTHRPPTVRDLLTYTSGLPQCVHLSQAFKPTLGEMVPYGQPVPSLAEHYRGELHLVAEPGTRHVYSNHGFATLGQIVEDVTGQPFASYVRRRILEPLGMGHTDLVRSERLGGRLATGYALRARGPRVVHDHDLITAAGGGIYSTPRDVARYVSALLRGGNNDYGRVLEPESVAEMFSAQYQPDPRLPGVGLAFYRRVVDGHLFVEKSGLVPGFASQMCLAPDDGVGVVAFTNGAKGAHAWLGAETSRVLCDVLGIADEVIRTDVPPRRHLWNELCGWYSLRGSWRDVQKWLLIGAEVRASGGQLVFRPVIPVPGLRGFPLHPDDPADPCAFRVDLSGSAWARCASCSAGAQADRRPRCTSRWSRCCRSTGNPRSVIRSPGSPGRWWRARRR